MIILILIIAFCSLSIFTSILYSECKYNEYKIKKVVFHARSIVLLESLIKVYPNEPLEIGSLRTDLKNLSDDIEKDRLLKYFLIDLINLEKVITAKDNIYKQNKIRNKVKFN